MADEKLPEFIHSLPTNTFYEIVKKTGHARHLCAGTRCYIHFNETPNYRRVPFHEMIAGRMRGARVFLAKDPRNPKRGT